MYIVIFCSLLALILTFLESKSTLKEGMRLGFILVTLLGVIHYNYGNDYKAYQDIYNSIIACPFNWYNLINGIIYKEPGWAILCYLFRPIGGFYMMVAVLNIVQNIIYFRFIKNNVQKSWWPIAMFIYLFSTNFYLLNFSMMRQGLTIAIFLSMWKYIKEKKWWIAVLGLLGCSLIHTSSLILLPFAFWGFLNMSNGKVWALIFSSLFIALWISDDFINNVFEMFIVIDEFQAYEDYLDSAESIEYGVGFIINMIPFAVSLYYLLTDKSHPNYNHQLVALAAVGNMVLPFNQLIPSIGRIGMYFNVYSIGAIAIAYSSIEKRIIRYALISLYVLILLYDYWLFFTNSVFSKSYSTFQTIFNAF